MSHGIRVVWGEILTFYSGFFGDFSQFLDFNWVFFFSRLTIYWVWKIEKFLNLTQKPFTFAIISLKNVTTSSWDSHIAVHFHTLASKTHASDVKDVHKFMAEMGNAIKCSSTFDLMLLHLPSYTYSQNSFIICSILHYWLLCFSMPTNNGMMHMGLGLTTWLCINRA